MRVKSGALINKVHGSVGIVWIVVASPLSIVAKTNRWFSHACPPAAIPLIPSSLYCDSIVELNVPFEGHSLCSYSSLLAGIVTILIC